MANPSAGILMYRWSGKEILVLLAHPGGPFWKNKDLGAWSIPKGEHGPDEEAATAARREFLEELGEAPCGALRPLGRVRQRGGKWVEAFALEGDFDVENAKSDSFALEWPPKSGKSNSSPRSIARHGFRCRAPASKSLRASSPSSIASRSSCRRPRVEEPSFRPHQPGHQPCLSISLVLRKMNFARLASPISLLSGVRCSRALARRGDVELTCRRGFGELRQNEPQGGCSRTVDDQAPIVEVVDDRAVSNQKTPTIIIPHAYDRTKLKRHFLQLGFDGLVVHDISPENLILRAIASRPFELDQSPTKEGG